VGAVGEGRNSDQGDNVSTAVTQIAQPATASKPKKNSFAFRALLVFSFLYFARPEDVIPGVYYVPVAKITGGIALIALITALMSHKSKIRFPFEVKLLFLLLFQMCLAIPFAYWRGGAFDTVFSKFSKAVIIAVLVGMLVETLPQLRKLLYVQTAAMSLTTIASLIVHRTDHGRLVGALGGIFENPNDLAITIALNFPLCIAFFLMVRGPIRKAFWAVGALAMLAGIAATYSRSGFLAMCLGTTVAVWQFGVRGRRFGMVFAAFLIVLALPLVVPSHYLSRLETILTMKEDVNPDGTFMSGDSSFARREMLKTSLQLMGEHPLFGIGPGNFPTFSGSWHVTHNTYTEIGVEAGIPALIIFLLILWTAHRNLRSVQKSELYKQDKDIRICAGALVASLAAYLVGAFFTSTTYHLFPYFLVAYTTGLHRIAYPSGKDKSAAGVTRNGRNRNANDQRKDLAWTR
jgi:O-antigen ligase